MVRNGRSGFRVINSAVTIIDNQIVENDQYGLINDGDQNLSVSGNWWGTTDIEELADLIRDGVDREGLGIVTLHNPVQKSLF